MGQEAELRIKSDSVQQTTVALDRLTEAFTKLAGVQPKTTRQNTETETSSKKVVTALKLSEIQMQKHVSLMKLQKQGLDITSQAYAKKRAEILTTEQATRKGIKLGTKEHKELLRNITVKEKAIASQKRYTRSQVDGNRSMGKFTGGLDRATKQVQLIDGPLGGVASRMTALSSILKNGALAWAGLALSAGLALRAVTQGVGIAYDTEVAMRSLEAQLQATATASGFTAEELDGLARSMAMGTLDSTEDLRNMIGVMLTFKKVSGDAFGQSIALAQDMGKALKQDPITATRTLGKVLQNPLKNYKQLSRAGIDFSESQVKLIKDAQMAGDIYAAQAVIIGELEGRFRGLSEAQADTLAGDVDTFGQKWDEVREGIGERLLPTFRKLVQLGSLTMDAFEWVLSDDVTKGIKEWDNSFKSVEKTLPELTAELESVRSSMVVITESTDWTDKLLDFFKDQSKFGNLIPSSSIDSLDIAVEKEKLLISAIEARNKMSNDPVVNDELVEFLKKTDLKIQGEQRLTEAFLNYGDTRNRAYREEKAAVLALAQARKFNVDGDEEEVERLRKLFLVQSDLTEQRVEHNTAMQIQKSLQGKLDAADKEIHLNELVAAGLQKNSAEYIRAAIAIDTRNKIQKAGLEATSHEVGIINKQSDALANLQIELQRTKDLKSLGLAQVEGGEVMQDKGIFAAQQEMYAKIETLRMLDLEGESGYHKALLQIRSDFAAIKAEELGIDFAVNSEGHVVAITEFEALENEKNIRLAELDAAAKEDDFSNQEIYLQRKLDLEQEYEEKGIAMIQANFEKSNAHKSRLRMMDTADSIAAGVASIAAVKKGNRDWARAAKLASMFKASVSLVDSIAEANKLPYPANIPAYAVAVSKGAQLTQMASSLKEPSFAFGGVDIQGAGTGRSDSISAKIASGESVMTQAATSRHKGTLERMNAGLNIGNSGGGGALHIASPTFYISGTSAETEKFIDERLIRHEERIADIARGVSLEVMSEENEVGGMFDPL